MKNKKISCIVAFCTLAGGAVFAQSERTTPFEFFNRLRVELDDNVYLEETDEQDSLKIIEELEFVKNANFGNTILGLRYNPSFIYWADRDEDDTDLHHQFDGVIDHEFSPRFGINIREIFRISELPELIQDGIVVRGNNDYLYNSISAGLNLGLNQNLGARISGRHQLLAYDEDELAQQSDYDKVTAGLDLYNKLSPKTEIAFETRYSAFNSENGLRDTDAIQVGGMLRNQINQNLSGSVRAGFETKEFDNGVTDSAEAPYIGADLTLRAGKSTINGGVGYSLDDSPVNNFVNQTRLSLHGGVSHDLTAKITGHLFGSLSSSEYDADDRVAAGGTDETTAVDGDETALRFGARVSYEINNSNTLEVGWQLNDFTSDVRANDEYTRNRYHIGWKLAL